ncbi:hypothetical protein [Iodidimonas sp. SYSU 1G8]|uniref:hypothetical protein n=1 Tax=Iodidimonas sp. SYSU 1G8 TaxID=3133967 RepID=UPI0031FEF051
MTNLKIPSLQHLARNWQSTPSGIAKQLIELANNPPTFNYNPLFSAVVDMLVLNVPYEHICEGIRRKIKWIALRENYLETLALIYKYFQCVNPTYVQRVGRRYYPVGRGLLVPFDPPIIYGEKGEVYFPWLSFWRINPLLGERLSLFVTLVEEMLRNDPELEGARFQILDFAAPGKKKPRQLVVRDTTGIPRLNPSRISEMLSTFAEGYLQAVYELSSAKTPPATGDSPGRDKNGDSQLSLI